MSAVEYLTFADCFEDISRGVGKIKQKDYLLQGDHPVIDQGQDVVAGYGNGEEGLCTNVPAIVFGDHTRCVKYVARPFFAGADGVKILKPRNNHNTRYWFHSLRSKHIENLGYSRHYKLLKECGFRKHTYKEQDQISARLDRILELINTEMDSVEKLDELVKSRFIEMFGDGEGFASVPMERLVPGIVSGTNVAGNQRPIKDGEYGVLKISAVTQGWFKADEYKVVDDVSRVKMVHPRKGDLLFSRANTSEMVGATAIVDRDYENLFLPDKLWRLDPAQDVEAVFLKNLLSTNKLRAEMSKVSTGTSGSMQNISMRKFRKLQAFLPPMELQREFAEFVGRVDKSAFISRKGFLPCGSK